ncbi:hypothetical protein CLAIMM_09672 [Cladophialophora immunda]|nr:hypothetical protein CLAIMM_09672 [Cladophialophora immunda]
MLLLAVPRQLGKWKAQNAVLVSGIILLVDAGLEFALVWLIRHAYYARQMAWPLTLIGVVAFVLLIVGYLPVPFELMERRGRVVGINFVFLIIDCLGALFSLMALAAQNTFDPLFGTLYALCASIEMSIFLSHGIWLMRTRKMRKRAEEAGLDFDTYPESAEWQKNGSKFRLWPVRARTRPTEDDCSSQATAEVSFPAATKQSTALEKSRI